MVEVMENWIYPGLKKVPNAVMAGVEPRAVARCKPVNFRNGHNECVALLQ